jgi:hypothetical protein
VIGLFTRDAHLADLAIDLSLVGELGPAEQAEVDAHLDACGACRDRHARAAVFHAVPLAPPAELFLATAAPPGPASDADTSRAPSRRPELRVVRTPVAEPPSGDHAFSAADLPPAADLPLRPAVRPFRPRWAAVGLGLAAAAAVALAIRPPVPSDTFTTRGPDLELEVFRSTPGGAVRLSDGSRVSAGDKLGFRLRSGVEGYAMVVGIDETGTMYPCWPQGPAPAAQHVAPAPAPEVLPTAVTLDATPGAERIVAIRCDMPFSLADLAQPLSDPAKPPADPSPALRPGCAQQVIRLPRG